MLFLNNIKNLILVSTLFFFPLFFLPFTQEYFLTNKFYLLAAATSLLLIISALESLIAKKLTIQISKLDLLKILFLLSMLLSILITSPNKIQALLNPNFGFVAILSLIVFTSYLAKSAINIVRILSFSSLVLSLTTIIFYFHPFENSYLPINLQFLRNHQFTPLGGQLDLAVFLFFILIIQLIQIFLTFRSSKNILSSSLLILSSILGLAALSLTLSYLYKHPGDPNMPLGYSWKSFVETLKNPLTALFGIGIDNQQTAFTRARDIAYNHSPLWQIRSFVVTGSALLHVAIESGLLGLMLIMGIFYHHLKSINRRKNWQLILLAILFAILIFAPASLIIFFIFFIALIALEQQENKAEVWGTNFRINAIYIISFCLIIFAIILSFFLSRSYLAEIYFKKSAEGLVSQSGKILYENQRQAILTNPFIERYHTTFSQTNLLLFNSLKQDSKASQFASDSARIALVEAQIATRLNPQKATHWENLAVIARNITDVNAPVSELSFTAYQQAILLDPQNPQYRFNYGALFYQIGDFSEAVRSFEHAVALKRDWPNAHYNLAWALYQNSNFDKAIKEMEAAISLLNSKKDQADLAKAKEDLATFKTQQSITSQQLNQLESRPSIQLNLPQPKSATPEIKLDLNQGEILKISTPESKIE